MVMNEAGLPVRIQYICVLTAPAISFSMVGYQTSGLDSKNRNKNNFNNDYKTNPSGFSLRLGLVGDKFAVFQSDLVIFLLGPVFADLVRDWWGFSPAKIQKHFAFLVRRHGRG